MGTPQTNTVLELRHSRRKLAGPLLLVQIIGLFVIYGAYALAAGMFEKSQLPVAYLGLLGGLFAYASLMAVFVSKLLDPEYLTLFENGTAIWKPGFRRQYLRYAPGVQWAIKGNSVEFDDNNVDEALRRLVLPPTLDLEHIKGRN